MTQTNMCDSYRLCRSVQFCESLRNRSGGNMGASGSASENDQILKTVRERLNHINDLKIAGPFAPHIVHRVKTRTVVFAVGHDALERSIAPVVAEAARQPRRIPRVGRI